MDDSAQNDQQKQDSISQNSNLNLDAADQSAPIPYSAQTVPPVKSINPLDTASILAHNATEKSEVNPPPTNSSFTKITLLIIAIVIALFAAVYLGVYYYINQQVDSITATHLRKSAYVPTQQPTPTIVVPTTVNATADWPQITLAGLSLKIPAGWWSGSSPQDTNTIYIHPVTLPVGAIPAYTFTVEKNTTLTKAKADWLAGWKLVQVNESTLTMLGNSVTEEEGKTTETAPRDIKVAFIESGNDVYLLTDEGTAEDHANNFDKILATLQISKTAILSVPPPR